jgi:uracil-DNA glycosylase
MQPNKTSPEFNFLEAALVKKTELFKDCTNIVVGKGNQNAKILFVGEAPGRNEDEQGVPFCGAAGKNLDKLLERVGLTLEDVYVCNILKCRPPENRDPTIDEIKAHTPWLLKQIKDIRPKVVCTLGNYATKFFLSKGNVEDMKNQPGITLIHGKIREIEMPLKGLNSQSLAKTKPIKKNKEFSQSLARATTDNGARELREGNEAELNESGRNNENSEKETIKIKLIPLFHPAAIIYNRTKLTPLWESDMEIVKREIRKVNSRI